MAIGFFDSFLSSAECKSACTVYFNLFHNVFIVVSSSFCNFIPLTFEVDEWIVGIFSFDYIVICALIPFTPYIVDTEQCNDADESRHIRNGCHQTDKQHDSPEQFQECRIRLPVIMEPCKSDCSRNGK